MSLILNRVIGGIHFDVKFEDKVCVMMGFSGTGKTFLLKTMRSCLTLKKVSCFYVSPESMQDLGVTSDDLGELILKNKPYVVLFDNASFYLSDDLLQKALSGSEFIIIGTNYLNYTNLGRCGYYDIEFESNILRVKRESYA